MLKYTKLRQSYQRNTVLSPHFQSRQFSVLDHLPYLLPGCFEICRHPPDHQHLHHSYAVAALRSGDDLKTVQGNLGHATAAFTLDVYGHVTDQMKQSSAARMEAFIQSVSNS